MTRFIAEIGSNHNAHRERCEALVDAAAWAGCRAVKLQVFRVEDLFAPQALEAHPELERRRAWEFPLELLEPVRERCRKRGVELGVTPFALWAVEELAAHVDFFKIASYELLWHPLIRACAATGRPLVLSTGMATLEEVAAAVAVAREGGAEGQLRLLHCVSGYPTPPEQANLSAIAALREHFGAPVGWSDHTCSERVVRRAVTRWGASDVELHIDLDGHGQEAGEHSWSPRRLRGLIASIEGRSRHTAREEPHARAGRAEGQVGPKAADEAANPSPGTNAVPNTAIDGDGVKRPMPVELPDVPWRADPEDGLRPLRSLRAALAVGV
jgi:sialic acid synthase SpsE